MTVKLNVLVYDGPGVSSLQRSLIESLRGLLSSQYDVIPVDAKAIQTSPWEDSTGLFVMPGGADLKYLEALDSSGIYKIKNYVERGGSYLGICAGGYFASNRVEFEMGRPIYEVFGSRPLGFCPAVAIGSVTKGFEYDSEIGAEALKLKCPDGTFLYAYANGAPFFKLDDLQENQASVLYRYDGNQEAAVVECKVGKGIATVCGPHLEISPDYVSKTIEIFKKDSSKTSQLEKLVNMLPHLLQSDSKRKILFTNILSRLGLSVNPKLEKLFDNYPIWIASTSTNILEQFKLGLECISSLKNEQGLVIKDSINEFIFALSGTGETSNIISTKLLFIHDTQQFELFDIEEYLKCRTKNSTNPLFGSLLFYTRVIGSTQTILDQNSLFSSILPNGAVFVASHQNQGRGRGKNSWISNSGCLQFSLRIEHRLVSSLVFIQYLFGLAVVQALKKHPGCSNAPIHLKWPNDIYAKTNQGLMKLGGILVTSEFSPQKSSFALTIGCGINILNTKPSACLQDFSTTPIKMESVLASILYEFEHLYNEMINQSTSFDCFAPFKQRYYNNWLHSNQKVLVERTKGVYDCMVIQGLDSAGFLKAVMENDPSIEYELQPDGNTFDMIKNLIRIKN